jgi:valyl-tRNA synthetase
MEKTYQPQTIEPHWYNCWEKAGYFKPTGKGSPYSIVLPPPNVTGNLHMGHGFQHTLMDTLIRYHRMEGFNTLWQGGVDHAGIATQIVVERQLEKENQSRHTLGREKFLEKTWKWKKDSGDNISRQMRRMGSSIDWSRERFTMDEGFSKAVQEAFIKLYNDGLIYRGKRLVNWDVKLQSAVSDLEVNFTEETGNLYYIKYYLENNKDYIIVATTRPETLFGDVAVAIHPEDERYKKLINQKVKLPLTSRTIPVIADESVDPTFGTGCVKITPGHDFNDYILGQKHSLPQINILNKNGTLNHETSYNNIDRLIARKSIIKDLENQNLLDKIEPYQNKIPRCERTGEIIEPLLTDQWYVKMEPLAKRAIKVVENGEIKFIPENWTKTYLQWLENIQDWCISRQLWWGHRIPAFYDENGNIFVGDYSDRQDLKQDEDVLDTWFSAALWPFATLGWPENTKELETFYPTNVLVTGFDIIFFWVARMVMFSLYFTNKIPFKEVYITGLIRDQHGQKMSKSKGNVLDPIDLIDGIDLEKLIQKRTYGLINPKMEKDIKQHTQKEFPEGIPAFGTDALRFTYCALANTGRDIRFDLGRVGGYRNFCNKLWNASRFVLLNTESFQIEKSNDLNIADQWILSRLQRTIKQVKENFKQYRFDLIAQNLYEFLWYDYCDWYLELAKINQNNTTRYNLLTVLESTLRLLHPLMPYITEEIWQRVSPLLHQHSETIQLQQYPQYDQNFIFEKAEEKIDWLKNIVMAIRNIRSEMQIPPSKKITVLLLNGSKQDKEWLKEFSHWIQFLARIETLDWTPTTLSQSATAVVGDLQLFIPLSQHINMDAEKQRLEKEIQKLNVELQKSQQKLNNPSYVSKAPEEVVTKERERVVECQTILSKLNAQLGLLKI